jgi:TPR repeat protein
VGITLCACHEREAKPVTAAAAVELPSAELGDLAMQEGRYAEAQDIWRTRAAAGDAEAQYQMGWMFRNGYGLAISEQQAISWWQQAADQGHIEAHLALANLYRAGGRAMKPDLALALPHLAVASLEDEEALALFRSYYQKGGKAVAAAMPEIIRTAPRALGKLRIVGPTAVELRPAAARPAAPDAVRLLPPEAQVVVLGRKGDWLEVGAVASGDSGWVLVRELLPAPQPSVPDDS